MGMGQLSAATFQTDSFWLGPGLGSVVGDAEDLQHEVARQYPFLFTVQNLQSFSVLYLPLIILASMVALFTPYPLLPAANQMGYGLVNEWTRGLK